MIEATCGACGTVNRYAEGEVPVGARVMACASCKSRVALPAMPTQGIPKMPAMKPPPIPVPVPAGKAAVIDLADLPAPKRASPLAGADASRAAPRSALSDVDSGAKAAPKSALDLDELMPHHADLPAPKGTVRGPMPGGKGPATGQVPILKPPTGPVPTVKSSEGLADLPAPKARAPGSPSARPPAAVPDLPAPKAGHRGVIADLPAPKAPPAAVADLPAPKAGHRAAVADLPAPKAPPAKPRAAAPPPAPADDPLADLPQPAQGKADLLAPKGFFDDLPQPSGGKADLPAPKGYFEDLPQPAAETERADLPAPKGFFDDLPQPALRPRPELPAPKGFFDDLPQPAMGGAKANLPAPKGFFDDLPQPSKRQVPAPQTLGDTGDLEDGGIDLGHAEPTAEPPMELDAHLELDPHPGDIDLGTGSELDLSTALHQGRGPELDLDSGAGPDLDLAPPDAPPPKPADNNYGDLDLAPPSVNPTGIRIDTPKSRPPARPAAPVAPPPLAGPKSSELSFEVEERRGGKAAHAERALERRRREKPAAAGKPARTRSKPAVAAVVLGLALAGGGGYYVYQRTETAKTRAAQIDADLGKARGALEATDPAHWQRATTSARSVLDVDATNAEALGIGAEAAIAGALDNGVNGSARIAQGKKMIADALAAGVTGPALDRAQAVAAIATNQGDRALAKLQPMIAKQPKSAILQLYVAWAQLAKGDPGEAIKAFDLAAAASAAVKVPALYGRGRAKLLLADIPGARTDFAAVLEAQKDHVGAQVGLAATLPPSQATQRESDLLAILARKDITSADPRAVLEAWTLAADVARLGGRLDVARERYRKALAQSALHVPALTGLALVEVRDNKLQVASELLDKALAQAKDDPDALLVEGELQIRQGKLGEVMAIVKALAARQPPLPPLQLAHLDLVKGKMLEAQGENDAAVDAYTEGAAAAGDLDLSPTMAAVEKLGALAKQAEAQKDDKKAAAYRARADQLLSALAERAQEDAQLAMTLGVAYLAAGDAVKAEQFLRRAVEMRSNDIEAQLELSKALGKLGRSDDAIGQLRNALAIDGTRRDVALELARAYEAAGHDGDAIDAYSKLLANKDADLQVRVHAGRFFAKQNQISKAAAQADPILAAEPTNPAGHYLKAEGLLAGAKLDDARKEIAEAVDGDPDPQYLDAQGRIAEASVVASGDTKYVDLAIRAYTRAVDADPKQLNALIGLGRLYETRKEFDKAIPPLIAASKLAPKDTQVMYLTGVAYQAVQQKPTAIQWLLAAVKTGDHRAEIQWRLAELYFDVNQLGECLKAYDAATRLGTEEEKQSGKKLDWLSGAWYRLGDLQQNGNEAATRHAWEIYVSRNPEPGAQLQSAKYWLMTHRR